LRYGTVAYFGGMYVIARYSGPIFLILFLCWISSFFCSPCPEDPLTNQRVCSSAGDPDGYARAMMAKSGVKRSKDQWQADADMQTSYARALEAVRAEEEVEDNRRMTLGAIKEMEQQGEYKLARKWKKELREKDLSISKAHATANPQ
jgi:hypothetical protein